VSNDVLSLLGKYVEERTLVFAVFVTPSRSVARVTGAIRVSVDGSGPHLAVGKHDNKSDQIKFRLSDCVFEYGDFRDEESADKYEGFLVVASSKGDTLSLDANKKITLNVRIIKTVKTSTGRVLQLDGGASFLEAFIEQYLVELKKFTAPGKESAAVVVVVDNDKRRRRHLQYDQKAYKEKGVEIGRLGSRRRKSVCGPHTAEGRSHEVHDRGLFR